MSLLFSQVERLRTPQGQPSRERSGTAAPGAPTSGLETTAWRPLPLATADILCVQWKGRTLPPHAHEQLALTLLLTDGEVRRASRRPATVRAGDVLVVPPGEVIAMYAGDSGRVAIETLLIAPALHGELIPAPQHALVRQRRFGVDLAELFVELRRPLHSMGCVEVVHALVARAREYEDAPELSRAPFATPLAPVRDYLRAHLADHLSTATLARISGLSEFHLVRTFHREFVVPPHAYQMCLRAARASRALSFGTGVSQVAHACGFADQSHLSRQFKRIYGFTPAKWRAATDARSRPEAPRRSARSTGRRNPIVVR